MIKKYLTGLISFILIMGICTNAMATELKTSLKTIEQASETKYLENDQGYISKTIVNSNPDAGEVTIELKLSNTKKESDVVKSTEIFLVLDNSISMEHKATETTTRKSIIGNSATSLINKIYDSTSNVKVGIVRFASKLSRNTRGYRKRI